MMLDGGIVAGIGAVGVEWACIVASSSRPSGPVVGHLAGVVGPASLSTTT